MKFENTEVWGFEAALRGMRNPKNSWQKSDSYFGFEEMDDFFNAIRIAEKWQKSTVLKSNDLSQIFLEDNLKKGLSTEEIINSFNELDEDYTIENYLLDKYTNKLIDNGKIRVDEFNETMEVAYIGPNDMKLAQTLIKAGPEHRKFLRQIFVTVDITAPLYWWKEADTYKIGTTANSTSTMHKLTSKPITLDCFEIDDFDPDLIYYSELAGLGYQEISNTTGMLADLLIEQLEFLRQKYLETKDKKYWKELVRWLPCGWLQTRTWSANYEVIHSVCQQRRSHKLNEWSGLDDPTKENFIAWAHTLPYAEEFIFYNGKTEEENN